MISGTVVQTLILTFIALRCEWEKEVARVVDEMRVLCIMQYSLIYYS